MLATPYLREVNSYDHGMFAQDRWTVNRLTVTAGFRIDHFAVSFPASTAGPGEFVPNRNISFPKTDGVHQSPDYNAATNRLDLDISTGVSSIRVE